MEHEQIAHHGIMGMKWGVRRYQNKDGSLTAAGKKRVGQLKDELNKLEPQKKEDGSSTSSSKPKTKTSESESTPKQKSIHEMTDNELRDRINRIDLERRYSTLTAPQKSRGRKIVETMGQNLSSNLQQRAIKIAGDAIEKKVRELAHVPPSNNGGNNNEQRRRGNNN